MTLSIEVPSNLDPAVRLRVEAAARVAVGVQLYREDKLTKKQLGEWLGKNRWEVEAYLKEHGVMHDLISPEELRRQVESVSRLGA